MTDLLNFVIFVIVMHFDRNQLQNADIPQLTGDSAAVLQFEQVTGVVSKKGAYGQIPDFIHIIPCSLQSLSTILQVVKHVGIKLGSRLLTGQGQSRFCYVIMIRVLVWFLLGKTLIPLFSPVLLCKFAINMLGESRERSLILVRIWLLLLTVNTLF